MSLKRSKMPITSFDPRYKTLILSGCTERVEIKQNARRDARRLSNLLTTFRARYRDHHKDNPALWEPLYGAIIGVSEDGYSTVIRPRAQEAEHLLRNISIGPALVDLSTPQEPPLENDPLAEFDPQPTDEGKNND